MNAFKFLLKFYPFFANQLEVQAEDIEKTMDNKDGVISGAEKHSSKLLESGWDSSLFYQSMFVHISFSFTIFI